jgi:hypothetical protein
MMAFRFIQAGLLFFACQLTGSCWASSETGTPASSASNTDVSPYLSIRALDGYGEAIQLKHAARAADRGRLVLGLVRPQDECIWIVSPRKTHHRHHRCHDKRSLLAQAVTSVIPLTVEDDDDASSKIRSPAVYVVFSGVKGDAEWVLRELREYAKFVAERYAEYAPSDMAGTVSDLVRSFWQYGEPNENGNNRNQDDKSSSSLAYQSPIWESLIRGENFHFRSPEASRRNYAWARPLGIRTMVISFHSHHPHPIPELELVEPSGIILQTSKMAVMGQKSEELLSKLTTVKNIGKLPTKELEETIRQAFASLLEEEDIILELEIISKSGIDYRILSNKNNDA